MTVTTPMFGERIAAAEKELATRIRAAVHLKGIPARQNANEIERLYDRLNVLHIARYESGTFGA